METLTLEEESPKVEEVFGKVVQLLVLETIYIFTSIRAIPVHRNPLKTKQYAVSDKVNQSLCKSSKKE